MSYEAFLEREYGEDSLVVKKGYTVDGRTVHTLDDLPAGAVIGTSSVRRVAQLKRRYPDMIFKDVVCLPFYYAHTCRSFCSPKTLHLKRGNLCVSSHDTNLFFLLRGLTGKLNLVYACAHKARRVSTNWITQTDPMPP